MRALLSCFILLVVSINQIQAASSERSDTIDIRKTIIDFTITDFATKIISAKTTLDIRSKMNGVNELIFDLEGLVTDSVKVNGVSYSFNFNSNSITIPLSPIVLNVNDTALVDIYYHGVPVADALWGGFSFVGNYGFQMGVGFNAQPHSYGRTWHPCFDNFVERSAYEFFITTNDTKAGICNGILLDSTTNTTTNTKLWHWKLDEEIPSYLACVAVCNYVFMHKNLNGHNGNVDALITCEPADTNKVNGSFAHLQQSFTMLEDHFGTFSWPRVGYSLVPFNAGAMEHATNISIGRPFIDGTLNYETLIAHELSHHWFGDLITCSTAGDMWLNEGFASYCEALHTETMYGYPVYLNVIKGNHYDILAGAHIDDDGYKSVANMDSLHTYGTTVYKKGEDMIHVMRTYMGDSLFFNTLRDFLNSHKFQSVNTFQLRDYLTANSGIDMTDYFKNWILAPGFPHFSIDSNVVTPAGGNYHVSVFMRQRKHHSIDYYDHVPLEIAFYNDQMVPYIYPFEFNGRCTQFDVKLPFNPSMIVLDPYNKISDAITEEQRFVKTLSSPTLTQAKCRIYVKQMINTADSSLIRIEHNWIAPDRFKSPTSFPGYVLCDSRYWKVDGINLGNIKGLIQFPYAVNAGNSYLDSTWIQNTEDSIRLFYRPNASQEWQFADDSLTAFNLNDGNGNVYTRNFIAGEYAFGIKRSGYSDPIVSDIPTGPCSKVTSISSNIESEKKWFTIFPNPTSQFITIRFDDLNTKHIELSIFDATGKLNRKHEISAQQELIEDINGLANGIYFVQIRDTKSGISATKKIVKE